MITPSKLYPSIDDYLGPAESRFFGAGYRRADHRVSDVRVRPRDLSDGIADATDVTATVDVAYPVDWSKKVEHIDLRPHLSTIDMLVLGAQLCEAHLAHAQGLSPLARRRAWLRKVTLRSGTAPQEDLCALQGTARLRGRTPVARQTDLADSTYECAIGLMRARYEIRHETGTPATAGADFATAEQLLGDSRRRYYGEGFKARRHTLEDVEIDMENLQAAARVRMHTADNVPDGLESEYQPNVSFVDCFVVNLQLAQVLMYELDSVSRRNSHTLWMLRTTLQAEDPARPLSVATRAEAAIVDKMLVTLRDAQWREVEIHGHFGGVSLRCSFAHQLPEPVRTRVADTSSVPRQAAPLRSQREGIT